MRTTEQLVLTVREVAAELQVCEKSVYRLLERGKLKAIPHLRVKRIPRGELARFIASGSEVVL